MVGAQRFWALDGLEFGFCSFLVYLVYGGWGLGAVLVCCLVCVSGFGSGRFRVWFVGYSGFLDLRLEWVLWYKVGVCCL